MADHIVLNAKSFMGNYKPVSPSPTKGHKKGNMSDHKPVNPHTPTSSPKSQASMVPKMSGPIKKGKGSLGSVK